MIKEKEYLINMKKIYKEKGLYPKYPKGWAEEIIHLCGNNEVFSRVLKELG